MRPALQHVTQQGGAVSQVEHSQGVRAVDADGRVEGELDVATGLVRRDGVADAVMSAAGSGLETAVQHHRGPGRARPERRRCWPGSRAPPRPALLTLRCVVHGRCA